MKELLIEYAKTSVLIVATHHRTDVDGVAKRTWVLREGRLTDGSPR
jgi:energy-coupling factor transporter ATP-binding protein EcfA2